MTTSTLLHTRETLRLCTAGSVDDGKSTLVGRLLHDTRSVLADTLASVERTSADRGFDAEAQQILTGRQLIVAGGPAAVSDESLAGIDAASVTRLGGADAFQTSLAIAEWELEHGMSASSISVASAIEQYNGVDALAASALAGRKGGVVLLAQSNPAYEPAPETSAALGFISEHASEVSRVHVLGGEVAQTPEFYQQIEDALGE